VIADFVVAAALNRGEYRSEKDCEMSGFITAGVRSFGEAADNVSFVGCVRSGSAIERFSGRQAIRVVDVYSWLQFADACG
jgi:hypothetical protein